MWQDLRYGIRMLVKNTGFTLVAVITLALGISANTTVFSAMESLILHPFSLPNQNRLAAIYERKLDAGIERTKVAPGNLRDWREQSQVFEQFETLRLENFDLTGTDQPERVFGHPVSARFLAALGVQPLLGRVFQPDEDTPGHERVVVLNHGLWQRRFGSDPKILGRPIILNGKAHTVIGVMPKGFNFPYNGGELWTPFVLSARETQDRVGHFLQVLGLLKPGLSLAQGDAEIRELSQRAQKQYPATNKGFEAFAVGLNEDYTRGSRVYLSYLLGAVAFVLLIACANVANLLLVRGSARQQELAVRMALGAVRGRVMRQLLTESLLLSLLGGVLGLLLSIWGIAALAHGMPPGYSQFIPGWEHLGLNRWVLAFTILFSLLAGALSGLLPAWQATKADFNETFKIGGKGAEGGARRRWRNALVVAEVALSIVLLAGAGLLIRSFIAIIKTGLGFNPDNAITMRVVLPQDRYPLPEQRINFYQELIRRVAALPGVTAVGAANSLPMWGSTTIYPFQIVGQAAIPRTSQPAVDVRVATTTYFTAIGAPLRAGRMFTSLDDAKAPRVILVNEAFARRYFPGVSAVGQQLTFDGSPPNEIVGIVANMMNANLDNAAVPIIYQPFAQQANGQMSLVIRGQVHRSGQENLTLVMRAVRQELAALDTDLPVSDLKTLDESVRERISPKRVVTAMLGLFALIALIMATVGLYAVMSFAVTQRTREIGIRMALGAQARDVFADVIKQGLSLVSIGVIIGLSGAFAMTRLLTQILYGVTASDPVTYGIAAALLIAAALVACLVPARRATGVDPMIALRAE
jgi:putative ABC transport system permease protein